MNLFYKSQSQYMVWNHFHLNIIRDRELSASLCLHPIPISLCKNISFLSIINIMEHYIIVLPYKNSLGCSSTNKSYLIHRMQLQYLKYTRTFLHIKLLFFANINYPFLIDPYNITIMILKLQTKPQQPDKAKHQDINTKVTISQNIVCCLFGPQ